MTYKTLAAAAALCMAGSGAMAWGDMYMGDGTHNPNSGGIQAYPIANNCPAGLQPVSVGGVICCGTPTMAGYAETARMPRTVHRQSTPRAYAPEGTKGVIYR